jgi:capsular exopolysaccharide synthesis family protein
MREISYRIPATEQSLVPVVDHGRPDVEGEPPSESEYESLSGLLRILRRRWVRVLVVAAVTIGLGVAGCLLMTPIYSATAKLEISQNDPTDGGAADARGGTYAGDELKNEVQTDIGILESPNLAIAVIKQLNLEGKGSFRKAIDPAERGIPLDQAPRTRQGMIKLFDKSLKVQSPEDTRLIDITYEDPDPVLAATIANTLGDLFIKDTLERRQHSISQSSYWLQKELDDLKTQVEDSEQKLADYEQKTGMAGIQIVGSSTADGVSSVSVSPHNTITERLFALNQELNAAEANRISSEMLYHLVDSQNPEVVLGLGAMNVANTTGGGSSGSLTSDGGIDLLRSLRAQRATLAREYASYSVTYGPNNSRLVQLQQQMDAIDQQMQAELQRIKERAQNAYLYAKSSEDSIRREFTQQQGAANVMADKTVQLQVLAQEAYSNRALYESLFSKLQTASLASGVRATRIDVVDSARPAGWPSRPEYAKYFAVILGFGIFLGVTVAFISESLDETVRTLEHLSIPFSIPLLGYVPSFQNSRSSKLLEAGAVTSQLIRDPTSPFSEAFRAIRTSILFGLPAAHTRSLMITSAMGGEGKTTFTYNLGVAFAQQDARVLLIDADLRNPELHRHFEVALSPGLSDVLTAGSIDREIAGVVRHKNLANLYFLPAGEQPALPAELVGSKAFGTLLEQCEARYDYVLIDTPPILPVADASIIATKLGGIIAVVRSGSTTRSAFSAFMRSLHRTKKPVIGVVLNDVRQPLRDDFYAYSYSRTGSANHA